MAVTLNVADGPGRHQRAERSDGQYDERPGGDELLADARRGGGARPTVVRRDRL